MTQTRRRLPEFFKREAVDQVFAGMPLRHVAETLGIAESLVGQMEAPVRRCLSGQAARRARGAASPTPALGQVTMECDVLKKALAIFSSPRSEVPSHSRPGNCWDNAAMESFFRSLKAERVYLTRYASY